MDKNAPGDSFRPMRRHSCPAVRLLPFSLGHQDTIKPDLVREAKSSVRTSSIYNHVKEPATKPRNETNNRTISLKPRTQSIYDDCIDQVTLENRDGNVRSVVFGPNCKNTGKLAEYDKSVRYKKRHSVPNIPVFRAGIAPEVEPETQHEAVKQCRVGPRLSVPGLASRPTKGNKSGKTDPHTTNRKNSHDSVDRELHYLFQNNIAERQLTSQVKELEKQYNAGLAEHRHQRQELYDQYRTTLHRTPTTDQWLNKRKSRINTLREQGRDEIFKRQNTFLYTNRPPPHLRDTVARVKSAGYFGTSRSMDRLDDAVLNHLLYQNAATTNKVKSRATMRRHTISVNTINTGLSSNKEREDADENEEEDEEGDIKPTEKSVLPAKCDTVKLKQILDFWQTSKDDDADGDNEDTVSELSEEEVMFAVQMLI